MSAPKESVALARGSTVKLRARSWRISLSLLVCFGVVVAALHTVLAGFDWWFSMTGMVLTVLTSAALTRAWSRRAWLPIVVASVVLLASITVFFAPRSAILFVIPTLESWTIFGDLGQAGAVSVASQSVPATVAFGLSFILSFGAGVFAIVADFVAITWRRPALAGVPLAVILGIPSFIGIDLSDIFIFALAAIAWLILLRAGQPFPQTARAVSVGALAIVTALVLPLALPQVKETSAIGDGFSGYLTSVNPVLKLGSELRRGTVQTILTYSTQSGAPTYLRLVSLQNFLPLSWEPDYPKVVRENTPSRLASPPGLSFDIATTTESTWVDVSDLGSPWLPVPYPATSVSGLRGDWFWDAQDLTFTSPDVNARGEEYRVESLAVNPTPGQLDVARGSMPVGGDKYLALPSDLPSIIGGTASTVTAEATSDYGRAVALQEYFRDGGFTYSETAPVENGYDANGMKAIAQFLQAKSGYCVHFASAMAIMARTLGIPSRVAVGFLPGQQQTKTVQGRTAFQVTTQDVHSWPELYFDGIGWTRFEPTPGRGFPPSYADAATPGVPVTPSIKPSAAATPSPTVAPSRSAPPRDAAGAASPTSKASASLAWLWTAIVVFSFVLLLLVPAFTRLGQRAVRMRRCARGHPAATTAWKELLQSARDLGIDIRSTATPREAAAVIGTVAQLRGPREESLAALLDLVERQSFGGVQHAQVPDANSAARLRSILDGMRSASGRKARIAAAVAPRSIWSRWSTNRDG